MVGAVLSMFGGMAQVDVAQGYFFGAYCGGSVNYWPNSPTRCKAEGATKRQWNYNVNRSSVYSNNLCAYISSGIDSSGAIYGSGCNSGGTHYGFCRAFVQLNYYAMAFHISDPMSIQMYADAGANYSCSGAAVRAASDEPPGDAPRGYTKSEDEAPPARVRALAASEARQDPGKGVQPDRIRSAGRGLGVYVVPAQAGICASLAIEDATVLSCTDEAHRDSTQAITSTPEGWTSWGLAADGATEAVVTFEDGSRRTVPITGNGYRAESAMKPASVIVR
jgi:hypothetical protein